MHEDSNWQPACLFDAGLSCIRHSLAVSTCISDHECGSLKSWGVSQTSPPLPSLTLFLSLVHHPNQSLHRCGRGASLNPLTSRRKSSSCRSAGHMQGCSGTVTSPVMPLREVELSTEIL